MTVTGGGLAKSWLTGTALVSFGGPATSLQNGSVAVDSGGRMDSGCKYRPVGDIWYVELQQLSTKG